MKKRTKSMKSALAFLIALTFIVQSVPAYACSLSYDNGYDSTQTDDLSGISGLDDSADDSYYDVGSSGDITQGTLGDADGGVDVYGDDSYDLSYDTSTVSDAAVSDDNLDDTISDDTLSDNGLEYQTITENVYNNCITITGNIPKGAYISAKKIWYTGDYADKIADSYSEELCADVSANDITIYYGFDIKICDKDGNYYQPNEYNESVTVDISALNLSGTFDKFTDVTHIDEYGNMEQMSATTDETSVSFETQSFSTYIIGAIDPSLATPVGSAITAIVTDDGLYDFTIRGSNGQTVCNSNDGITSAGWQISGGQGGTAYLRLSLKKGATITLSRASDYTDYLRCKNGRSGVTGGDGSASCLYINNVLVAVGYGGTGASNCSFGTNNQLHGNPGQGGSAIIYTGNISADIYVSGSTLNGENGRDGGSPCAGAMATAVYKGTTYSISYNNIEFATFASDKPTYYVNITGATLPNPTRIGYSFDGWTDDSIEDDTPKTGVKIAAGTSGNKSFTAHWSILKYTIKYETNGANETISDDVITYGTCITEPTVTKDNMALFGWFTDAALTNEFNFSTLVTADTTLYAKWSRPCTVNFHLNSEYHDYSLTIASGKKLMIPATPAKEGNTFTNWYSDENLTSIFNFDSAVTADTDLYAEYIKNSYILTVVYGDNKTFSVTQPYQSTYEITTEPVPNKGDRFTHWKITSGNGTLSDNCYTFGSQNSTVTAQFSNLYNVHFESNHGSAIADQSVSYDGKATEPNNPTRIGYTFNCWCSDQPCQITYDFDIPIKDDITLYAKWTANTNTKYTVEHQEEQLDGTYKTVSTDYLTGTTDTTVTPNTNNYSGFTSPSEQDMNIDGDGNATIIYKYTRNSYELSVVQGEGIDSVTGSGTYKYGQPVVISAIANAGYRIKNYTGGATSATFRMPARNITVMVNGTLDTAKYTVTYEQEQLDGTYAVTAVSTYSGTVGTTVMAPLNTYDGYTTPTAQALTILDDGTATVIYKYPRRSYTVTIIKNEGISSVTGAGTYKYGEPVALTATVASGYTFYEWAGGEDSAEFTMPAEDIDMSATAVVYAGYHNVAFISNTGMGIESQSVINNGTATEPVTPSRSGYDFNGWYINSNCSTAYAFMTPVTADITLYAGWKESASGSSGSGSSSGSVIYTTYHIVSFVSNGGTAVTYQNVADGNTASEPAVPTYAGHIFVGWYTNTACTLEYNFANKVTADTTLYAKWTTGTTSSKTSTTSKSASNSASTGTSGTTSAAYRKTTSTGISLLSHTSVLSTNAAGTTSGNIASGISSNTAEFSNQSMSANRTNMLIETNGLSDNTVSENAGQTTKKSHAGLIIAIILGLLAIMGIIFIILYKKKNDDSDEDDVFDDDEDGDNDDDGSIPESDADIMDEGMTDDDEDTEDK